MLKCVANLVEFSFLSANREFNNFICNSSRYQCVRWKRKPRWLPTAKSRLFKVPPRPNTPFEEWKELKRLSDNYKTEMKSLRLYFAEKIREMTTAPEFIAEQKKKEDEEHAECIRINNEWNVSVATIREAREAEEKLKEAERILTMVEAHRKLMDEKKLQIEEIVRKEKVRSKTFITAENIERAIEEALENPVDHNFSIDLEGNIYKGFNTKPNPPSLPAIGEEQNIKAQVNS